MHTHTHTLNMACVCLCMWKTANCTHDARMSLCRGSPAEELALRANLNPRAWIHTVASSSSSPCLVVVRPVLWDSALPCLARETRPTSCCFFASWLLSCVIVRARFERDGIVSRSLYYLSSSSLWSCFVFEHFLWMIIRLLVVGNEVLLLFGLHSSLNGWWCAVLSLCIQLVCRLLALQVNKTWGCKAWEYLIVINKNLYYSLKRQLLSYTDNLFQRLQTILSAFFALFDFKLMNLELWKITMVFLDHEKTAPTCRHFPSRVELC